MIEGHAPERLLDSYDHERVQAADENLVASTRSTDFITPKSATSRLFRDAVLDLSEGLPFARPLVNSGRLSVPCVHDGSPLNGPDHPALPRRTRPGAPASDAPLGDGWLVDALGGRFRLMAIDTAAPARLEVDGLPIDMLRLDAAAAGSDPLRERYLGDAPSAVYLIRPDQHVAARWASFDEAAVSRALRTAVGHAA